MTNKNPKIILSNTLALVSRIMVIKIIIKKRDEKKQPLVSDSVCMN
jgi:hypothetical protein